MLSLNMIVRAVIVHDERLLVTVLNDGKRPPFFTLLGGHQRMGESILGCVAREVFEEVGLQVAPSRLLYIAENFFLRGNSRLHEIGYYFLCHPVNVSPGDFLRSLKVSHAEMISPELLSAEQLAGVNFQPPLLRDVLVEDMRAGFTGGPKLLVVNELPGDSTAETGVYKL
jgi:8-oxo-dGTP pyrophosphatase MutT (NUDIX family)